MMMHLVAIHPPTVLIASAVNLNEAQSMLGVRAQIHILTSRTKMISRNHGQCQMALIAAKYILLAIHY